MENPASMLMGDDVFNVKREAGIIVLVEPAVFAALLRSPSNQFPRRRIHHESVWSRVRALAWRMATTFAART